MGSIAVGDVIRLTARMLIDGVHDVVSVYHHKALSTNVGTDDDFMVGAALFLDTAHSLLNPGLTTRLTYVNIEGINVTANRLLPSKDWPTLIGGVEVQRHAHLSISLATPNLPTLEEL